MQSIWVIAVLALVAVVVAFEEQDFSEDFQNELEHKVRNRRWLFKDKCKAHSDCGSNACCDHSWFGNSCTRKRGLFQLCSTNPWSKVKYEAGA
ncbi:hypothetical protein QZH41_009934 [Actinostola sp. cb2023]|nr:hypothetical protein QZH41_009934 [Actinostola sp. cb2023]